MLTKKMLFAALGASLSFVSLAQFKMGFTVGANYNMPSYKMSSPDTLTNPNQYRGAGAHGGLYSYLNLAGRSQSFGIQQELMVSTRNHNTYSESKEVVNDDIFYYRESFASQSMIYFDIPVHFRFNKVFKKGKFGDANLLGVFVGAQTSILISRKYEVEHTYLTHVSGQETILRETNDKPDFTYVPFEWGLSTGVLYEMQNGLRLGVRYYRSFSTAALSFSSLTIKNQMLMAFVGFNFLSVGGK